MAKTASKSFSLSNSSQKLPFFAVLIYALYGHPRYFKFKRKYQQYGACFQTTFPFLMPMAKLWQEQNWWKKIERRVQFLSSQRPIGNKNILNRKIRDRQTKNKKLLPPFKNIQVKNRGRVVKEMIARRKTTYPAGKQRLQYWLNVLFGPM